MVELDLMQLKVYKGEQQAQQFTGCQRRCQGLKVRVQGHYKDEDL